MTQYKRWRTKALLQERAKQLRQEQTPAERKLWSRLRHKQLYGLKFRRQHPIGHFVVDFCCVQQALVVEIDGDSHSAQEEYDQKRTTWLEDRGYRVIRFTNRQVEHQIGAVLNEIARVCGVEE
jgi:very-short-patch-repair endonuclease